MNHHNLQSGLQIGLAAAGVTLAAAVPSDAAIINPNPQPGETITLDANAPNPVIDSIFVPDNVTIDILPGAVINGHHGRHFGTIRGGRDVTVNNAGTVTGREFGIFLADGSVNNTGMLTAELEAIVLLSGGTIENSGTIRSDRTRAIDLYGDGNVVNSGTIQASRPDQAAIDFLDRNSSAPAIPFDNRLTLQPGSDIRGYVDATSGSDTLALGGDTGSDTFDVGDIGSDAGYRNFEVFRKEGNSTWTLTGSGDQTWTIARGTLAGDAQSLQGDLINDATVIFDQAADGTYGGQLSGTGHVIKTGTGGLSLTAANTYTGGTTLREGTLVIANPDAIGSGTLTIEGGTLDTKGTLSIANDISVRGDVQLGSGHGHTLYTTGIVDLGGDTRTVTVGPDDQWRLENAIVNGSLVIDGEYADLTHTASDSFDALTANAWIVLREGAVAPTTDLIVGDHGRVSFYNPQLIESLAGSGRVELRLSGKSGTVQITGDKSTTFSGDLHDGFTPGGKVLPGILDHAGTGSLTLTGNTHAVELVASRGTLIHNGIGTGHVVIDGGTLKGDGSIGSLDARRGIVAPGNSIGTLSVRGDVTLAPEATYEVEIHGDGTGDRIAATGHATLKSGTTLDVVVVGGDDLIRAGDAWTILTADGGVSDEGAILTEDFAGFDFTPGVTGNAYRITAMSGSLADAMTSPTARVVAKALDDDRATADPSLTRFIDTVSNQTTAHADRTLAASTARSVGAMYDVELRVSQRYHASLNDYLGARRLGMPQLADSGSTPGTSSGTSAGERFASVAAEDPRTLAQYFDRTQAPVAYTLVRTDTTGPASFLDEDAGLGWVAVGRVRRGLRRVR